MAILTSEFGCQLSALSWRPDKRVAACRSKFILPDQTIIRRLSFLKYLADRDLTAEAAESTEEDCRDVFSATTACSAVNAFATAIVLIVAAMQAIPLKVSRDDRRSEHERGDDGENDGTGDGFRKRQRH